jgi:hypothetical protein
MEELLGLPLFIPTHLHSNNILTLQVIRTLTLKKDYVKESVEALLVCVERVLYLW